jgi:hypothetical protein
VATLEIQKKMNNLRMIHRCVQHLKDCITYFDFTLQTGDEKLNRLFHLEDISVKVVANIPAKFYRKLIRTFGKSLRLKIKYGADEIYNLNGAFDLKNLISFRKKITSGDVVGVVTVSLDLNKRQLAVQILEHTEGIIGTVVFQQCLLKDIFSESVVNLDRRLKPNSKPEDIIFNEDASKYLIIVPEMDVWMKGERLAIVGGRGLLRLNEAIVPPTSLESEIRQMRQNSELNVKWVWLNPLILTPFHFKIEVQEEFLGVESKSFLELLYWLQFTLSLIYISDSARYNNKDSLIITFSGASCSSQLTLPLILPQDEEFKNELKKSASILLKDCLWVYEDERTVIDRVTIVQSVIAQAFPGSDRNVKRLIDLLKEANIIHSFILKHWKIFTEGKVSKYFDKVKEISEFIAIFTRSFGEQIDSIIKSLSNTMLGAVVTVIGTFVGSLLSKNFDKVILLIGISVYAGYIAIFPGLIGMTNSWQQFSETRNRMNKQFEELKSHFQFPVEVKDSWNSVKIQLENTENRFKTWFKITGLAYALVLILAIVLILSL